MDELYWNVTGDEWDMPILHASGRITLPAGVPLDLVQAKAFTGRYGEKGGDFTLVVEEGPIVRVETTDRLSAGEGLTAVVIFPPGHVTHPSHAQRLKWWLADNWYLVIPLLLVLLWCAGVARLGSGPDGRAHDHSRVGAAARACGRPRSASSSTTPSTSAT